MSIQNKTLSEKNLRDTMTSFYNAIISAKINTGLLLTEDPWEIDPKEFGGRDEDQEHMDNTVIFLERINIIAKNKEVYQKQFLTPIKLVTENLIRLRGNKDLKTDIEGWVFAKSKSSKIDKQEKITVPAVFPELQCVMSISIHEDSFSKTTQNYHKFTRSQPIGLVNRVHQTVSKHTVQENKTVSLAEFSFLFTSFSDINNLSKSIEMENFCNIPSEQSEKKTHMGYSFVSFGRIMDADAASVTIKSVSEKPKNQIFTLTNHFYENGGTDPRKMVGKHVRFFGVKWYDSGYKNDIDFEGTEIFLIQEEQDVNRLKVEEILGHIRLRANVSVKEAEKLFAQKIVPKENIEIRDNLIKFKYKISKDPICEEFIQTTNKIRNLREEYKISSPVVSQEQVIDVDKSSLQTWVQVMKSTKFKILFHILLNIQIQNDLKADVEFPWIISKLKEISSEEMIKRSYSWLKKEEFVEDDPKIKLTNTGEKILASACKEDLDKMTFKSQNIVKLENIEKHGIPTSVFKKYLEGTEEFQPFRFNDRMETKLIWIKKGSAETDEGIRIDYLNKRNKILDIMRDVWYPLTVEKISIEGRKSEEHLTSFIAYQCLLEMSQEGLVIEEGGSWTYPIHARAYHLFKEFPDELFDIDTICRKCGLKTDDDSKKEIEVKLDDFVQEGLIGKIASKWSLSENMHGKIAENVRYEIRKTVLNVLERASMKTPKINTVSDNYWKKPTTDYLGNEFVSEISKEYFDKNHEKIPDQTIKEEIEGMVENKTIPVR